ncbi:MAG: transposase, partial [Chloroflexi bacterium]|nr:transposase [Chloroflexota bacterium]
FKMLLLDIKTILRYKLSPDLSHFGKQPNITLLACMAQALRYFEKAKDNDPKRAEIALRQFQKLYTIERKGSILGLNPEETWCLRHEESLEMLTEMEA